MDQSTTDRKQELAERLGEFDRQDRVRVTVGGESYIGIVEESHYSAADESLPRTARSDEVELELSHVDTGMPFISVMVSRRPWEDWDLTVGRETNWRNESDGELTCDYETLGELEAVEVATDD